MHSLSALLVLSLASPALMAAVPVEADLEAGDSNLHYAYGHSYGHHASPYSHGTYHHSYGHQEYGYGGYGHHDVGYGHHEPAYGHHAAPLPHHGGFVPALHHGAPLHHASPLHLAVPHHEGHAYGHDLVGPYSHHDGPFGPFGFYANFYHH